MIQGSANTTPENPAEILNGYQSGTESLILKETVGFKQVGHSGTYLYNNASAIWGEAQYS
jgi:hypothetical protein